MIMIHLIGFSVSNASIPEVENSVWKYLDEVLKALV
jgi:hypothetical protein